MSTRHQVPSIQEDIRLVDYCGSAFPILGTKSSTKKALKKNRLYLNGKIADGSEWIIEGDQIELRGQAQTQVKAFDSDLEIIYEDDHLLVVNKPAGIATNGNRYSTAENAVIGKFRPSQAEDALERPVAAHRLDVPTRGLLILSKSRQAQVELGRMFQSQKIQKFYHAVAHGKLNTSGRISLNIQGKKAFTHYELERAVPSKVFGHLSLVKLMPKTGRTHQLRIHLSSEGHFIVGDKSYNDGNKTILGKGLLLAATGLEMKHPISGKELKLQIPIPPKFLRILDREESRFNQ